ncbi:MAG: ABC transporter substrate-binding protein [Firmicutes bacterium]|nr:ABC transporter substrate-binding protein [[Eubacterium] siraeum]MCM1486751.1 ABC transporter substrate-binding protein [Bacillota bacterium]
MKKLVAVMLTLAMVLSFAGCNQNTNDEPVNTDANNQGESTNANNGGGTEVTPGELVDPYADMTHDEISKELYDANLGDFITILDEAKSASSVSERFAKMAIAEAKLLEQAVLVPSNSNGGRYAISRVAPNTVSPILWGTDNDRFHQVIVATEFIKSEDRAEMKEHYNEVKGTGEYEAWAKQYLTDKGYTIKDTYDIIYPSDPKTWDWINTYRSADSEALCNMWDGLMEYDMEGVLQPALAESYTVSADGLTYTFKLREGVQWVDSQGREIAEVVADDFVAGMQHMMDSGAVSYLVDGVIKNAAQYNAGDITDIEQVGVKATDKYTVEYTLEQPVSYFLTMLSYHSFAPLCRSYYEGQGGKFGADFDAAAADYNYGKSPDTVVYCGPYLVTNFTATNTIVFDANPAYWNKDGINIKKITWHYSDGSDPRKPYDDAVSGVIDGVSLTETTLPIAQEDGNFDAYHYISATDATTFTIWFNLYRAKYTNFTDDTKVVSQMTDEQKIRANLAMGNQHFRLALAYGVDRATYNAQVNGEGVKLLSIRNSYTPGNFVTLDEDITVDINGTATSFKAGTNYGEILQAQITADGYPIKVYDPAADDGAGSSDGFDGWYNVENAKAEMAKAVEELAAQGVEISAENPLHFDFPYAQDVDSFANRANAFKKSVEASLDGMVVVDLVPCGDGYNEWYDATYYFESAEDANYNSCDNGGWGPDYGDPQTYLNTMLPDYSGDMTKMIGVY